MIEVKGIVSGHEVSATTDSEDRAVTFSTAMTTSGAYDDVQIIVGHELMTYGQFMHSIGRFQ